MKVLKKYLRKRERALTDLLKNGVRSYDARTVHALRVEIKKMGAFFELIEYTTVGFNRKKMFKPFKVVFRQAGKLRELQLEESMLKEYAFKRLPSEYQRHLKKQRLQEQKNLFTMTNNKIAKQLKKNCRKMYPFASEPDKKKVSEYMKHKQRRIEKIVIINPLRTQELHKLRKHLKELEYNLNSTGIKRPRGRSVKATDLPVLLGKWHDCQVMIRHLESVTHDREKHPKEVAQINKIVKSISADRDSLLEKVEKALKSSEFNRVAS